MAAPRDRLQAMQVFLRVIDMRSFTAAAEGMGLPKANVSRLVRQLEDHLGATLLHRTTRRVQPTADGERYARECHRVLAELDAVEGSFGRARDRPRGRLRVEVPAAFGSLVVVPALPDFFALYPDVELDLGTSDRWIDLVGEGIDCALRGGALPDSGLVSRPLPAMVEATCASPGYLERHGLPRHPDDLLDGHRTVQFVSSATHRAFTLDFVVDGQIRALNLPGTLTVSNATAYAAACAAGLGIVQMPWYHAAPLFAAGELVEILADYRPQPWPLAIVWPRRAHMSAALRVFIDWLAARAGAAIEV